MLVQGRLRNCLFDWRTWECLTLLNLTANSLSESKYKNPVDTADAKGDDTKTAEKNAMDNTEPEVKDIKADDKLTGPEMWSCSLGYPHSVNHHQMSNLKKEEE